MPGYKYQFAELLGRHVICPLCQAAMRDPVRVASCGHRFCDSCLQDYLSEGPLQCPVDNSVLDYAKIYPDPDVRVEVMESQVRCVHYKEGCRWVDKLQKLQAHLDSCRYDTVPCPNECAARLSRMCITDHVQYTCPYRRVTCSTCSKDFSGDAMESHQGNCPQEIVWCENKCGARLQQRYLNNHTRNECHKRTTPCPYCQKQFVFETLQNHYYQCPRFPVSCPNRCDPAKVPREELDSHVADLCPSAIVQCPFQEAGCKHMCPRFGLDKHLDESCKRHLQLTWQLVRTQQDTITVLTSQLQSQASVTDGTFIWRVSGFKVKMAEARLATLSNNNNVSLNSTGSSSLHSEEHSAAACLELRSQPFYTSRHGYKMAASLFPNGNGSGEGTHVSLYIRVVPGDYDNLLDWPFRMPISFRILDQCADPEKRAHVSESFVPNPSWRHFQRPSADTDQPMGFGYPRFLSHEALKNGAYVKDDTLFVRIKVDTSKFIIV